MAHIDAKALYAKMRYLCDRLAMSPCCSGGIAGAGPAGKVCLSSACNTGDHYVRHLTDDDAAEGRDSDHAI